MAVQSVSQTLLDQHTRLAIEVQSGRLSQHDVSCLKFVMRTIEHQVMGLDGKGSDGEHEHDDDDDDGEQWKRGTTDTLDDALDRRNRWELPD